MFEDLVEKNEILKKKFTVDTTKMKSCTYIKPGIYTREVDLTHIVSDHTHNSIKFKNSNNIYYGSTNLGTPEEINKALDISNILNYELKEIKEEQIESVLLLKKASDELKTKNTFLKSIEKQIDKLANFIIKNYGGKIIGSAVETTIDILSNVKSIEYNNGSKEEYKDGVIVGANGPK